MRDGILLAEDPPASLIQTHCLSVSAMTIILCVMVLIFGCSHTVLIVPYLEASFLQTLEDVFLKLCRRQEEEKVVEFGESLNIVSSVKN